MPDLQRVEIDGKIEKIEVPDGVDVGEFLASAVAAIRADRAKPKAQAQNAAPRPLQGSLNAPVPVDPFRDGLKVQKPAQGNKPPKPIPAGFGVIGGQDLLPEARDKKPAPRAEIPKGEKPGVKGPILPSWKRQFEDQRRRDQANAPSYRAMTDAEAEKMPRRGKGESESSYQQRLKQSIETADAGNRTVAEQLAHLIGSGLDPEAMTATNERMGGLGSLLLGPLAGLSDLRLLNESEKRQLSPAQKFGASLNVGLTMAPGLTHAAGEGVVGALTSAPAKKLAGAVAQGFDQATKSRADRRLEGHVATALRQALGEDVPQFDIPAHGDLVSPGEMPGATFRKPTGKAGLTAGQRAAADASPAGHMTTAETLGPDLEASLKSLGIEVPEPRATGQAVPDKGLEPTNVPKAPEPSPKPTPAATGNVAPTAGISGAKEPWQMTIRDYTGHEPTSEVRRTDLGNAHRTAVEQAFKQGKDVPGKVLADYPWLAADKAIKPYVDNLPNLSDKELKAELEKAGAELNAHRGLYGNQTFFEKQNRFSALGNEADARASGVRLTQSQYFDRWLNKTIDEKDRPKFLADQEAVGNVRKQTDANHRSLVAQALKDGKPVPPEVLADYPDLAAKYGKPTGPTLSEAVQSGRTGAETRRVGAEDFKPKPTEPMQGPSQATGLANQVQDREALQGILDQVEPTKGKSAEDWQKIGKAKVESGEINPHELAQQIADGDVELTGERVGALLEGKRRLELDVNNAKPGAEYEAAKQRLQDYVEQVQQGKGRWSDVGRALQAGTTVDEGNFAQVIEHARRSGAELNPKQEAEIRRLADQVKSKDEQLAAAQKIIEDQQASMTAQNVARAARRLKTGDVQKARDAARARFVKASAANTFVNDEQMAAWWDLAKTYVQKGDTPDSLIERIRKDIGDQLPDYITDADMKAAMALGGKPQQAAKRARTEIEKEIAKLRREAKAQSGVRDAEAAQRIQARIADLQDQLDTGQYRLPKARAAMYGPEVEKLQAQRDVLAAQVRAGIEAAKPKTLGQKVGSVLSIPKTLRASVDLSAPGRQGWLLSLANPEKVPAAFGSQIKAMLSEEGAAKAGRQIAERPNAVNGVYKRAGLEMTDYATGLGKHEEVFASNLLDRWTKGNPFRASDRAYSGYLNRIRADVFDKMAAALGDSPKPDDLKAIANYINVATGRQKYANQKVEGLIQGLGSVMWAPRLAASRMEYLAGKPLYSGGSAKAKVLIAKEYGKVLAGTAAMLGLAKAGGADVELDPRSSDFLKIKVGDTRIDALAGLTQWAVFASRMATGEVKTLSGKVRKTGEYASPAETGTLIQRFGRSKLNPVVGTAWDLREKKDFAGNPVTPGSAAKNLLGPLSATDLVEGLMKDGWHEDDAIGLLNFFGIGVNTYDKRGP